MGFSPTLVGTEVGVVSIMVVSNGITVSHVFFYVLVPCSYVSLSGALMSVFLCVVHHILMSVCLCV